MTLVLDASITLAWYFNDEGSAATDAVLDDVVAQGAVVPMLWRLEVANALQMALRRERITSDYRDAALADLAQLDIRVDPETSDHAWTATLQLADRYRLTLYDAAYLELAQRRRLGLATMDGALQHAAKLCDVRVLGI
ncbi:MAG: type II toxin-antitoxin system VapC family toxin [Kiloniellales bacterium]